jgi:hypothetical protein
MKSTEYQHLTQVDESKGEFRFDCSGFLCYALSRIDPEALEALPVSREKRPLAQDFFAHFAGLDERARGPWKTVKYPIHLKPGDVVSWLKPPGNDSHNTGHLMLVREPARWNPARPDEILVPILDSTSSPHAEDGRTRDRTGLGQGTIGIIVDAKGRAIAYRWRGGISKEAIDTEIAFGRLE